jgi:hypothetical protein
MYNVNIKNKQSVLNIFGSKDINNNIFKPSKYFMGSDDECFHIVNHDYVNNFNQGFDHLYSKSNEYMARLKCINDQGYIIPLQKEYIKLFWNTINNSSSELIANKNKENILAQPVMVG